jgi:fluoride ion exporter CrcB/FEX
MAVIAGCRFPGCLYNFSTFEYETGSLIKDSEIILATLNVLLSVFLGFVALKTGEFTARIL